MADMPMLSETAEPAAESLPDRGKHGGFLAATAWAASGLASSHVVSPFVDSRFTSHMQPPVARFVNLWAPRLREAQTGAAPFVRDARGS